MASTPSNVTDLGTYKELKRLQQHLEELKNHEADLLTEYSDEPSASVGTEIINIRNAISETQQALAAGDPNLPPPSFSEADNQLINDLHSGQVLPEFRTGPTGIVGGTAVDNPDDPSSNPPSGGSTTTPGGPSGPPSPAASSVAQPAKDFAKSAANPVTINNDLPGVGKLPTSTAKDVLGVTDTTEKLGAPAKDVIVNGTPQLTTGKDVLGGTTKIPTGKDVIVNGSGDVERFTLGVNPSGSKPDIVAVGPVEVTNPKVAQSSASAVETVLAVGPVELTNPKDPNIAKEALAADPTIFQNLKNMNDGTAAPPADSNPTPPPAYTGGATPELTSYNSNGVTQTDTATGAVIDQNADGTPYRAGWVDPNDPSKPIISSSPADDGKNPYTDGNYNPPMGLSDVASTGGYGTPASNADAGSNNLVSDAGSGGVNNYQPTTSTIDSADGNTMSDASSGGPNNFQPANPNNGATNLVSDAASGGGYSAPPPDPGTGDDLNDVPTVSSAPNTDQGNGDAMNDVPTMSAAPASDPGNGDAMNDVPTAAAPPSPDPGNGDAMNDIPVAAAPPPDPDPGNGDAMNDVPVAAAPPDPDPGNGDAMNDIPTAAAPPDPDPGNGDAMNDVPTISLPPTTQATTPQVGVSGYSAQSHNTSLH